MNTQVLSDIGKQLRPGWAALIAPELHLVERKLRSTVTSDVLAAIDLSMHLLSAGGKRIRPTLLILSGLAASPEADRDTAVSVAASVELIHMASLVHDDVVDETRERRGVSTANANWGNKISVLGGDYLLSKAFALIAAQGDAAITRVLSATAVTMSESELLQAVSEGSLADWEANYWRIIHDKTAHFMGACCECGAIVAKANGDFRTALTGYGVQIGIAFQITDDCLDLTGNPARTGKEVGTDLLHGKFTLPVLLALQNLRGDSRCDLLELVNNGGPTVDHVRSAAKLVIDCGAVDLARQTASSYATKARERLSSLASSEFTDALESLTTFVITRET